jgi:hypothetical protein
LGIEPPTWPRGGRIGADERALQALIKRLADRSNDPLDVAYSRGTYGWRSFFVADGAKRERRSTPRMPN